MPRQRTLLRIGLVLSVFLVGYIDTVTGYEFSLVLCYFIPVAIVAWYESWRTVAGVALLSGVVWYLSDRWSGATHSHEFYRYWEGVVKVATFIIVGRTIYKMRRTEREKAELNSRLAQSEAEVRELRELAPVCGVCRTARTDDDHRSKVDRYLARSAGQPLQFGRCPECRTGELANGRSKSEVPPPTA